MVAQAKHAVPNLHLLVIENNSVLEWNYAPASGSVSLISISESHPFPAAIRVAIKAPTHRLDIPGIKRE
jgi:hypothetical protein